MKLYNSGSSVKKHLSAAALLLPAIGAALVLEYAPTPLIDLFVYGGTGVFIYNLCILILAPYFVLLILALGDLYVSRLPNEDLSPLKRVDLRLLSFFVGCGLLTILGFILGLLKLLYFWVCFPTFVIVIYLYFLHANSSQDAIDLWDWVRVGKFAKTYRWVLLVLRTTLISVIASIVLSRGILLELFKDGGLHQYFAYFADTRLYHSIWMNPSHPILYDYLAGRGQGVYLFFTSFTNQFTIQIIGVIYLIAIGLISRQVISLLLSAFGKANAGPSLRSCLPDLVMLLVLTSPILDMETARFHLQTGAFFLFLSWAGCLFLILEHRKNYWLFLALIPLLIAFPIVSGIFYAFEGWVLGTVILSSLLTRNTVSLKYLIILLGIGAASTIFSFSLNYFYVGIPEIQPARAFVPFIWMERFQYWSSPELLVYLDSSMKNSVLPSTISIYKISSNALTLFSYPLGVLIKQINYPRFLLTCYAVLVFVILIWLTIGYLRGGKDSKGAERPTRKIFIYWLTFTSLYALKFFLTLFVQQSSLTRMLLFMDIFPIITFFSMGIYLIHRMEGISFYKTLSVLKSPGETIFSFFKNKYHMEIPAKRFSPKSSAFSQELPNEKEIVSPPTGGIDGSLQHRFGRTVWEKGYIVFITSTLWGGSFSLVLINLWPYFWRRSFPIQLLLFSFLVVVCASLFFIPFRKISRFFAESRVNRQVDLLISLTIVSMICIIIFFSFTSVSRHIAVPHTLKVSAIDEKHPASSGSAVKLLEIKIDEKPVKLELLEQSGVWSWQEDAIQSHGQAALTYVFSAGWDSTVEILFEKAPTAGWVQIEYDDQKPVVKNLYANQIGSTVFSPAASLFGNETSLALVVLLWIAEFIVFLGLLSFVSTFTSLNNIYFGTYLLFGLTLTFLQFQANMGPGKIKGGWQYFSGNEGAIEAYGPVISYGPGTGDRADVFHCLEILKVVPGSAQVLNLNGFAAVEPCLFSPLLPYDKIVHHYEAVVITEPYYRTLMFGEPQTVYKIYRDLGINYFYLRKGDLLFVNLGYSRALEPQNLEKYFDVYAETEDFYIFTWRGQGLYPVSAELSRQIDGWYNNAKKSYLNFWWLGRENLESWIQAQP
jgi:hypothetical protein